MRIAVIADVHGNLPALEAVLDDVRRQAADRLVVNGDHVNRAPQGVAVVRRLLEVGAELTLGNHDELLRAIARRDADLPGAFLDAPFWSANRWCARELAEADLLDAIADAPRSLRIEVPGAPSVLVSHGSPRHVREGLGPRLSAAIVSEIAEMHPADVYVGSHTHHPMRARWGAIQVLNTGAVGVPFNRDGRAQYLLLDLGEGRCDATFRRVAYDREATLAAFDEAGYLAAGGLLARLFRDEIRDARSYLVPYQMWAVEHGHDLGEASWERFVEANPRRFEAVAPWPETTETVEPGAP